MVIIGMLLGMSPRYLSGRQYFFIGVHIHILVISYCLFMMAQKQKEFHHVFWNNRLLYFSSKRLLWYLYALPCPLIYIQETASRSSTTSDHCARSVPMLIR